MNWKILFTKPKQEAVQKGQVLFLKNDLMLIVWCHTELDNQFGY